MPCMPNLSGPSSLDCMCDSCILRSASQFLCFVYMFATRPYTRVKS